MKLIQRAIWLPLLLFAYAAADEDESPVQHLRRNLQVATINFGTLKNGNRLGNCEGDCSTNADCQSGLVCYQRNPGDDAPGCSLSEKHRNSRVDFCVASSPQAPVASPVRAPTSNGGTNEVSAKVVQNGTNLQRCQGDCDKNSDCQSGLVCYQRNAGDSVPGCSLTSSQRSSSADFCVASGISSPSPPSPAASPVRSPPTGNTFALKLYWEPGYYWQEERVERKWCASCRNSCRPGNKIAVYNCDDDSPTQWEFVYHGPYEAQIKVANGNICVEEVPDNELELATCDSSNQKQRFIAFGGSFSDKRFEVSPKQRQGWCMTQRHHPKNKEVVNIEPCITARKSDTSYWNKY